MIAFLQFRRMITPVLIALLYVASVVVAGWAGVALFFIGAAHHDLRRVGVGVLILILGPFVARLICEAWIVVYRISETLTDIHELLETQATIGRQE